VSSCQVIQVGPRPDIRGTTYFQDFVAVFLGHVQHLAALRREWISIGRLIAPQGPLWPKGLWLTTELMCLRV